MEQKQRKRHKFLNKPDILLSLCILLLSILCSTVYPLEDLWVADIDKRAVIEVVTRIFQTIYLVIMILSSLYYCTAFSLLSTSEEPEEWENQFVKFLIYFTGTIIVLRLMEFHGTVFWILFSLYLLHISFWTWLPVHGSLFGGCNIVEEKYLAVVLSFFIFGIIIFILF